MLKSLQLCLLFGALMALLGCGEKADLGYQEKQDQLQPRQLNQDLSKEIEKYSLDCEQGLCYPFMGMLVAAQNQLQWRCSSFFIEENIVATAAHCLPRNLNKGDDCRDDIFIVRPKQNSPVQCLKVLELSQNSSGEYDYAFLEVEAQSDLKNKIPSINRKDRLHGQKLKIIKIDPETQSKYRAKIQETNCHLNQNSLLSVYFRSHKSPQIQYSGCQTESGNSGAPLLNHENQIIGIHHSSTKPSSDTSLVLAEYTNPTRIDEFSSATNFGCLCPFGKSYRRCLYYKSCHPNTSKNQVLQSRQDVMDRLLRTRKIKGIDEATEKLNADRDEKYFKWTHELSFQEVREQNKLKDIRFFLSLRPKCLKQDWQFEDLPIKRQKLHFQKSMTCEIKLQLGPSFVPLKAYEVFNCQQSNNSYSLMSKHQLILKKENTPFFSSKSSIPYCR